MSEAYNPNNRTNSDAEKIHTVESYGGKSRYIKKESAFPKSEIPVLVAGGWSMGIDSLDEVGDTITSLGRDAILIDHARSGNPPDEEGQQTEVIHKANTLIEVLNALDVQQADVIAHSEGALNAVLAALQNPERFRSLILVAPAGMIGKDSFLALAGRFTPKVIRGLTKDLKENPRAAIKINTASPRYIAQNPAKAIREVSSIASTTIDEVLTELRQAGIQVGLIQSHSDSVFPPNRIAQNVVLDERQGNVDAYASVVSRNAGHDDLLIHPERTVAAAIQMIEQFE